MLHLSTYQPSSSSVGKKRPRLPRSSLLTGQNVTVSSSSSPLTAAVASVQPRPAAGDAAAKASSSSSTSSTFRNVSACNRCRLRKNRCDQRLPRCQLCEKAGERCVGYDPITKREVPRSYVYFLESRVAYLERLLREHRVDFEAADAFDEDAAAAIAATNAPRSAESTVSPVSPPHRQGTLGANENAQAGAVKSEGGTATGQQQPDAASLDESSGSTDSETRRLDDLVSNIGMVSVQGTSDSRYLGSTSGISFARVVFAAVKKSVSCGNNAVSSSSSTTTTAPAPSARISESLPHQATGSGPRSTMRDSCFGLQTRPTMKCAAFPDRELADKLVDLYFEYANPQMPILHRGEFMELLNHTYSVDEKSRSPRSLYTLNIVFAIGAGIIYDDRSSSQSAQQNEDEMAEDDNSGNIDDDDDDDDDGEHRHRYDHIGTQDSSGSRHIPSSSSLPLPLSPPNSSKKQKLSGHQFQPEEYHASAIIHLESVLGSSASSSEGFGGLEELQAVLLLASFALLRPVAPGLWYIVGVAMRLAVDLGLHYEDGAGLDSVRGGVPAATTLDPRQRQAGSETANGEPSWFLGKSSSKKKRADSKPARMHIDQRELGRREWVRDLRRRLWWCVYSFDRLVATCVGRPVGIADQVVTTEMPSLLDDKYITKAGFVSAADQAPDGGGGGGGSSSYKQAAHHYFKLRLLQSEIQDVLQYQHARLARKRSQLAGTSSAFARSSLSSPYLQGFDSFRSWRRDVHRRLDQWKDSAPSQQQTGVRFPVRFLELNYWQAIIMLYRQSLTVPVELARELTPQEEDDVDVSSPSFSTFKDDDDNDNDHGGRGSGGSAEDDMDVDDDDEVDLKIAEAGQKVLHIYRQMHRVKLVNYTYLATHHLFMAGISFLYAIWRSPLVRKQLTLDKVESTVLAATSVLGDLMHKCPPAKACRDSFERMSKATVQMCLATTGFGPQILNTTAQLSALPVSLKPLSSSSSLDRRQRLQRQRQLKPHIQPSRPIPKFDMNLADLFHDVSPATWGGTLAKPSPSSSVVVAEQYCPSESATQISSSQQHAFGRDNYDYNDDENNNNDDSNNNTVYSRNENDGFSQSTPPSKQVYHEQYGSEINTQQQQQQQQQQQDYYMGRNSPHSISSEQFALPSADGGGLNQQAAVALMDFDIGDAGTYGRLQAASSDMDNSPDWDYQASMAMPGLLQATTSTTGTAAAAGQLDGGFGIDLGFGMADDFEHDWRETGNYELLDGYFFRG